MGLMDLIKRIRERKRVLAYARHLAGLGLVNETKRYMKEHNISKEKQKSILKPASYTQGINNCLKLAEHYAGLGNLEEKVVGKERLTDSEDTVLELIELARNYACLGDLPSPKERINEVLRLTYKSIIKKANYFTLVFNGPAEFSKSEQERDYYKQLIRFHYFPLIAKYEEKFRRLDMNNNPTKESTIDETPQEDITKSLPRY